MPRAAPNSSERAEWLAARALLASRRLKPLYPVAFAAFAAVFTAVYVARAPLADRAARTQRASLGPLDVEQDTVALRAKVDAARQLLAQRDSALRDYQFRAESRLANPALSAPAGRERDSLRTVLAQLDAALDRAAKAPLTASYGALAATPALRTLGIVQPLVDTLELLETVRRSLDPAAAPQREFARVSERANAIGAALQAIGHAQRSGLARRIAAIEATAVNSSSDAIPSDSILLRGARDSASRELAAAEAAWRDERLRQQAAHARTDSIAQARAARILGASPLIAALSALLLVSALAFTLAVVGEVRRPTLAHAREAERLAGVPVLASADAFRVPKDGRARLQPGTGVDPFRMVYLSLTASGTRHRIVCVTGDDAMLTVAVAGRIAVSAAADERATLVVDMTPGTPSASAYFGWRDEPGFTDAIAGVRLWREVSRPIGASEGLDIEVIPAGAPRSDTAASISNAAARRDLSEHLAEYDFTVLVAPSVLSVEQTVALGLAPPTLLVVRRAKTRLQALSTTIQQLADRQVIINGMIIIDTK
ncbi:MAG: hypothetical protein ACYC7F_00080 [Gemmatimonadaceae bacterium]